MKVAFCNRRNCFDLPGGDTVQMMKTKEALESLYDVDVHIATDPQDLELEKVDLFHIFNVQTAEESLAFADRGTQLGKPIALSTIYWDMTHAFVVRLFSARGIYYYPGALANLSALTRPLLWLSGWYTGHPSWFSRMRRDRYRRLLELCDIALPNSLEELSALEFFAGGHAAKAHTIVNAVDAELIMQVPRTRHKDPSVICVGRIEPLKNQYRIIQAMMKFPQVKITLVGRSGDDAYFHAVAKIARKRGNVDILTAHFSHEVLIPLVESHAVHVLPSFRESPGLSTLEAIAAGLPAVVADHQFCPVHTYFSTLVDKRVFTCNPYSERSIRTAIENAMNVSTMSPCNLQQYVRQFSWHNAAEQTMQAYNLILEGSCRPELSHPCTAKGITD